MILLPNLCMQWAVASLAEVTVESTIVSSLIHPIPEVFVLGTGPTTIPPLKESDWYQEGDDFKNLSDFRDTLNEQGTQLEILDSVRLDNETRVHHTSHIQSSNHGIDCEGSNLVQQVGFFYTPVQDFTKEVLWPK